MRRLSSFLAIGALLLASTACENRTDRTDGGGVLLSISDFDGLPIQVSANGAFAVGFVSIDQITVQNITKDPGQPTSDLMNVEMKSYEVTFSRADTGTRVPPPLVRQILGLAPVNGTETYDNLPILTLEQLDTIPISDLLVQNGSFDKETGLQTILLNFSIRFFGRTITGDEVATAPEGFTVEIVP